MLGYPEFKKQVSALCGIDLSYYKSQQMDRRINSFMGLWNVANYDEYFDLLKRDPKTLNEFINKLTINVSEFYRNPERFEELQHQIIPELLLRKSQVRIWSAGCSDGSEPYSIAIIIRELQAEQRVRIIASDIDRRILQKAQEGIYNFNEVKSLPVALISKYFRKTSDHKFQLTDSIKKMVDFRIQNLLTDSFETNLDLIVCRNVVIYFTEDAKNKLYYRFIAALRPGGYILVGGTEPILQYRNFGLEHKLSSFYQKPLKQVTKEQQHDLWNWR
ncbi:MAG: protein-glutamate O-methyltransferase CheR [Bacillota bacterium]|jgi:chemotaxis protein methyltransferase CheR